MSRCCSAALVLLCIATTACGGPLGPFSGGTLSGDVHSQSVESWTFAQDVEVVQLETQPQDPHSINVWIGVLDNRLFI